MKTSVPLIDDRFLGYVGLQIRRHSLLAAGRERDEETGDVEDRMGEIWEELDDDQRSGVKGVGSDLNWLRRGGRVAPKARPREGVSESDLEALRRAEGEGDWHSVLYRLRDCAAAMVPQDIAAKRVHAYTALGMPEVARLFTDFIGGERPQHLNGAAEGTSTMGKRYVFFRTPHGQPYRGEDGRHAPAHILADIGRMSSVGDGGGIQWPGFLIPKLEPALRSAAVIIGPGGQELNEIDAWDIVWKAIGEVVKASPGEPISPPDLLEAADRKAAEYYRLPEESYVLVSSLSLKALPEDRIAIAGCEVALAPDARSKYPLPQVLLDRVRETPITSHLKSSRYLTVTVTTRGRSVHAGVESALNALNLLRGLWSLFATYGSWRLTMGQTAREPLGVIHTGPIHTLHTPDGHPVGDVFWYDPDFTEDRPLFDAKGDWSTIEKNRRFAMDQLGVLKYSRDLESLFLRYAAALDQPNPDLAFLQMWSILEKITDTVGANYDETIKRTLWLYSAESRPVVKDMLEALRHRRNQYVHSGRAPEKGDQVAYLIKDIIDPHLVKLVQNRFEVESLREYGEFLSLPTDQATLEDRFSRLGKALRFVKKPTGQE